MMYYGKSPDIKSEKASESDTLGFKSLSGLVLPDKRLGSPCCTENVNNNTCLEAPFCLLEVRYCKCLAQSRSPGNDNHSSLHNTQKRKVSLMTVNKFVCVYKLTSGHLFRETLGVLNR